MDPKPAPPLDLTTSPARVLQLTQLAQQLAQSLADRQQRLVLAESCTGGNVAGALAAIPGISNWFCGSFVIYRNDSKSRWLGIPQELLDDPEIGPVSQPVTERLAQAILDQTPEAELGGAVTGHIGPGAPEQLDGQVFLCVRKRSSGRMISYQHHLSSPPPTDAQDLAARWTRLVECTHWVLAELLLASR